MDRGIVEDEDQLLSVCLPASVVLAGQHLLQVQQEHQPLSLSIGTLAHLAVVDPFVTQGTND